MKKISNDEKLIKKYDFVQFARSSGSVRRLVDKEVRSKPGSSHGTPVKDRASTAFKAIDSDCSGYLEKDEFLNFTRALPRSRRGSLFNSLDTDGNGKLDLEEFSVLFKK